MKEAPGTRWIAPALFFSLWAALSSPLLAATLAVDRTDDDGSATACTPAPGDCSLRGAIQVTNANAGQDTIELPDGTFVLTASFGLTVNDGLVIQGASRDGTIIDGNGSVVVLTLSGSATLTVRDLTVRNGFGTLFGAGILVDSLSSSLLVERCAIRDNVNTYYGAGIFSYGYAEIDESVITGNRTANDGAGLRNRGPSNLMLVRNSLVAGNTAGANGGGIANAGMLSVQNTTITGNTAGQFGGGLFSSFNPANLTHVTLAGNSAGLGNAIYNFQSHVTNANTLIAGDCDGAPGSSYLSLGGNLESPGTSCGLSDPTDRRGVANPMLAPLADNGGETRTLALLPGSPAIDGARAAVCVSTDQRGVARPQGLQCDTGAYEAVVPCVSCLMTCAVDTDHAVYADGETLTLSLLRFENSDPATPLFVRVRLQLEIPEVGTVNIIDTGAGANIGFPPGTAVDLAPLGLVTLDPTMPRGNWRFRCALEDAATGVVHSEAFAPFEVR